MDPIGLPTWPRVVNNQNVWWHSDICKVAFFYVNTIFRKIVAGEIQ